nr:formyltetrahydrofolate deformylase [Micromonospora sp. NBRC 107566]
MLVTCADRPGIVAAVSGFLHRHGANVVQSDQYSTDARGGRFFMRTVFQHEDLGGVFDTLQAGFDREVASPFGMSFQLRRSTTRPRIAIFVSRYDHCLLDLIWRWQRGQLPADIGLVVSNHPDLRGAVEAFGVPFEHVPVRPGHKAQAERRQLELLRGRFDLLVLARYMQILSADFLSAVEMPAVNIHHSFLPAFAGAKPYEQAQRRGVKLIGATAHYVTEDLDEGPIIEQDVIRVSHRATVPELTRLGADIERAVLSRAVHWHCTDRVLRNGTTTVIF